MLKLGCIADEFSAAMDLAHNLVLAGMRVVLARSVPQAPLEVAFADADAVVIAMGTRHTAPPEAVMRALSALVWLKAEGAAQIYFAFSPTFDSRFRGDPPGNIGPVIDALMEALNTEFTVVAPAFPDQQCTVYKGYLFVAEALLSECGMQNHPLTPMTDANLLRVLRPQTRHRIGRIDHAQVSESNVAVQERLAELRLQGVQIALADTTTSDDLIRLAIGLRSLPLVAGSAGLGLALPQNFGIVPDETVSALPHPGGFSAVICGSTSDRSARQIEKFHARGFPAMAIDPLKVAKFGPTRVAQAAIAWAAPQLKKGPVLLYSTANAQSLQAVQSLLGVEDSARMVGQCLSEIALGLVQSDVRRLIIAGTQTAQSCMKVMGVTQLWLGSQHETGIAWAFSTGTVTPTSMVDTGAKRATTRDTPGGIHICLKPGSAGSDECFVRAFEALV